MEQLNQWLLLLKAEKRTSHIAIKNLTNFFTEGNTVKINQEYILTVLHCSKDPTKYTFCLILCRNATIINRGKLVYARIKDYLEHVVYIEPKIKEEILLLNEPSNT